MKLALLILQCMCLVTAIIISIVTSKLKKQYYNLFEKLDFEEVIKMHNKIDRLYTACIIISAICAIIYPITIIFF